MNTQISQALRAAIADDAFAASFQTLGQYRQALVRILAAEGAGQAGQVDARLAAAVNSLRWMLNITAEYDRPNMRASTLLDKHKNAAGQTVREDLEHLWQHFAPVRDKLTSLLLHGDAPTERAAAPADLLGSVLVKESGTLTITAENMTIDGFTFRSDEPGRPMLVPDVAQSVKAWANEMMDKHLAAAAQPSAQPQPEAKRAP